MSIHRIHHKKKMTIPIAVIAGIVPGVMRIYSNSPLRGQSFDTATAEVTRIYTGYDWRTGGWNIGLMRYGLWPLVAGFGIHKLAQGLGINRMISNAGIPLLRI